MQFQYFQSPTWSEGESSLVKCEGHAFPLGECQLGDRDKVNVSLIYCDNDSKFPALDTECLHPVNLETMPWTCSKDASRGSSFAKEKCNLPGSNRSALSLESSNCHTTSQCSSSMAATIEIDTRIETTSSGMMDGSVTTFPTLQMQQNSKIRTCVKDRGSAITVKATYKEDTVRFKFEPCKGCFQLFEEVGKRFKLSSGTFQIKYLDNEEEWVMLASNYDFEECLELLEFGSRSLRLLVRNLSSTAGIGSSSSSNCFLTAVQ